MTLADFNNAERADARAAIQPCLDITRWLDELVDARPFKTRCALATYAYHAASPFTTTEIDDALAHHPRLGERAAGSGSAARMSATEQAGLGASSPALDHALAEGNAAYEQRFDRVFLIRATGRSRAQILTELERRLKNPSTQELGEIAEQLRQIAVHRLEGVITA